MVILLCSYSISFSYITILEHVLCTQRHKHTHAHSHYNRHAEIHKHTFFIPYAYNHTYPYPKFFNHTETYKCTHTNKHAFTPQGSVLCRSKDVNRIELGEQKEERRHKSWKMEARRTDNLLMEGRRQGRNQRKCRRGGMLHQPPDVLSRTQSCQSFYRTEPCSPFPSGGERLLFGKRELTHSPNTLVCTCNL